MQITQTLNSININTDDFLFFKEIKTIINKNFSQNLGKKSKIISFYVENEIPQRRYFLKMLSILNKKYNNKPINNINTAHYKSFKLKLIRGNNLKLTFFCNLEFSRKNIIMNFDSLENKLILYIKNYFKKHTISILKNKIIIEYLDEHTLKLLESFCSCNEHLNYCLSFTMNEISYFEFKKNIKNEIKKDNRFLNICMLLENDYKILGLEAGATFEEIRSSYLKLSKKYHPDFHGEKSEEVKKILKNKFEEINIAYENLKPLYKNIS